MRKIFDRRGIVRDLEARCFGAEGASAALVCGQKVGKSEVLEHMVESFRGKPKVVTCKVNLDLLKADQELSDEAFLRTFVGHLRQELADSVDDLEQQAPEWRQGVQELANKAHSLRQAERRSLEKNLADLDKLKGILAKLDRLLDGDEPIRMLKLTQVLGRLKRIGWRVVLVIDDFHDMLTTPAFSDNLFLGLRGANNERKIVSLVASTAGLMEDALHRVSPNPERKSYFNHFIASQLEPFDDSKSNGFIDWLEQLEDNPERKLDDKERRYLIEIGGGSPYFLRLARDEFFRARKPATAAQRREFETNLLGTAFAAAFESLWSRSNEARRQLLHEIAGGRNPPDTIHLAQLEREGFVRRTRAGLRLFARMFEEFVTEKLPVAKAADRLKILFLAANPKDETELELKKELGVVRKSLQAGKLGGRMKLEAEMATRPAELLKLLTAAKPQIVQFSGHGGPDELIFVDEEGEGVALDRGQIEAVFAAATGSIRVVIFNACYSRDQAEGVRRQVECTVGIKKDISDLAARGFSEAFYRALARGHSVDEAFQQGTTQVQLEHPDESDYLELLARPGVNPAEVYLLSPSEDAQDAA